jgi:hypothetical protein
LRASFLAQKIYTKASEEKKHLPTFRRKTGRFGRNSMSLIGKPRMFATFSPGARIAAAHVLRAASPHERQVTASVLQRNRRHP